MHLTKMPWISSFGRKILKVGFLVKLDAGETKHFFLFLAKNWMLGGELIQFDKHNEKSPSR